MNVFKSNSGVAKVNVYVDEIEMFRRKVSFTFGQSNVHVYIIDELI